MNNYDNVMLPPAPVAISEGMWVKIYTQEGYTEVTDRAGAAIDEFDCYAHALEFVRYNKFRLKTVHRTLDDGAATFLHLVGE
jgi:hypothetical protein